MTTMMKMAKQNVELEGEEHGVAAWGSTK